MQIDRWLRTASLYGTTICMVRESLHLHLVSTVISSIKTRLDALKRKLVQSQHPLQAQA